MNQPPHPPIHLGEAKAVYLSPSWEAYRRRTGRRITWGYYQFPDLCRAPGGQLYLRFRVGPDSAFADHEPPVWHVSDDNGQTWTPTGPEQVDLSPLPVNLPDGRQVCIGDQQPLQHHTNTRRIHPARHGLRPVSGPFFHPYTQSELVAYRLNGLPEQARALPLALRESAEAEWTRARAVFDVDGMLKTSALRARTWWADEPDTWIDLEPWFKLDPLRHPVVLPDGTMLATAMSQHPEVTDRKCEQVLCLQSTDAGRTWTFRAVIAGDTELTTHGYAGENQLRMAPNGELVCVIRTLGDLGPDASRWLAQCRSTDGGRTWSCPRKIAEFCVTPQLIVLASGAMVVGYGRPGVYLRTSADHGRSWSDPVTVHGPDEMDLPENTGEWFVQHEKRYSCANITTVVIGPDRFLLAYSDFQHPHPDGGTCKAIIVREVMVSA